MTHKFVQFMIATSVVGGLLPSIVAKAADIQGWDGPGWYVVGSNVFFEELMGGPYSDQTQCAAAARPIQDYNKERGEVVCKHLDTKPDDLVGS
jgi:hypothetical protein